MSLWLHQDSLWKLGKSEFWIMLDSLDGSITKKNTTKFCSTFSSPWALIISSTSPFHSYVTPLNVRGSVSTVWKRLHSLWFAASRFCSLSKARRGGRGGIGSTALSLLLSLIHCFWVIQPTPPCLCGFSTISRPFRCLPCALPFCFDLSSSLSTISFAPNLRSALLCCALFLFSHFNNGECCLTFVVRSC